jgi:hypothetical protein
MTPQCSVADLSVLSLQRSSRPIATEPLNDVPITFCVWKLDENFLNVFEQIKRTKWHLARPMCRPAYAGQLSQRAGIGAGRAFRSTGWH